MFFLNTLSPVTFKLLANPCGRLFRIVLFLTACFTTVAAQTSAYVVRQANANEVVVIDTSTNLILATIPSGGEQTAVARAGTIKIVEMHLQNV